VKLGLYLRNMGPQSATDTIVACARAAEQAGIDDLWVADHIAIPPDDAEGSGGRYLDPLATLAFLAGMTRRIGLGTGVLVLPYRPPLATAKWIATIQELSGGRLLLGVGAGWMEAEFRAVGVPRDQRSKITDQTLAFLHQCFAHDEVEANGQHLLFRPRPARPPIFIGGTAPHALRRSAKYGDGWMPMGEDPGVLRPLVDQLRQQMAMVGKEYTEVVVLTSLALDDVPKASDQIQRLAEIGATRVVHAWRYPDASAFARTADTLRRALPA
jgi:probable F420-dependent oxidoreductase